MTVNVILRRNLMGRSLGDLCMVFISFLFHTEEQIERLASGSVYCMCGCGFVLTKISFLQHDFHLNRKANALHSHCISYTNILFLPFSSNAFLIHREDSSIFPSRNEHSSPGRRIDVLSSFRLSTTASKHQSMIKLKDRWLLCEREDLIGTLGARQMAEGSPFRTPLMMVHKVVLLGLR
ncbi:hypothetical protein BGZ60DRAFT_35642 [Tricladium varicosporioides]|nr:hypothetical protein BGZ60DRAFT_35642 [Hymenoscyphus varicosporioides]